MNRPTPWLIPIAAGLVLGVTLGLVYTWLITPVQYRDTSPDRLRPDLKAEYILLICETYAADGDWPAAQERLAELGDPDIATTILEMAERAIEQGNPVSTIRHLAAVASRQGVVSSAVAYFLPTRPPTRSPSPEIPTPTATPSPPPLPTATPSPRPTATPTASPVEQPTRRPQPTPTAALHYRLLVQQRICDADRPDPLLQIIVRDANEDGISGAEIVVTWGADSVRLFTGLKPELGHGYTDLIMEPGTFYAVRLAAGSEEVSGIHATPCTSRSGPRLVSVRLIFQKLASSS